MSIFDKLSLAPRYLIAGAVFLYVLALSGCAQSEMYPIQETYKYSVKSKYYVQPAAVDGWAERSALTTNTKDGKFFCFTDDKSVADDFINTQRTLVEFLRNSGVKIGGMEYYGTDYGYSFSESSDGAVYVSLADVRSWQQVLVTLQTIWGDYADYGYVYAMSNAISEELGWQTDSVPAIGKASLDAFFSENSDVINLLYPTFTTKFASEETVSNSKALAVHLFQKTQWKKALENPVEEQLDTYYELISAYAQELSVPFERQTCGYAYYGENVKLRIMTTYAELIIDRNYHDVSETLYGDYWSSYSSIYETANTINEEITTAVEYFGLEDEAGTIQIKWLDSEKSTTKRFIAESAGMYYSATHIAYVTSIRPYLHEYYHHLEHLLNPNLGKVWQSQAFCEIGSSHSRYAQMATESTFGQKDYGIKDFHAYTGRAYQPGRDDYFVVWDIMCHMNDYYQLAYMSTANSLNSFSRYLIDLYGEREVYNLMLFPDTIEEITGKTWEQLASEWEKHIRDKYADVQITN